MKLLLFPLFVSKSWSMTLVADNDEISRLSAKVNKELNISLLSLDDTSKTKKHLIELIQMRNSGKLYLKFLSGVDSRGIQQSNENCECSTIFISSDYIDNGVVSTLIHEFEHLKHELLLGKDFFRENPEIDELTNIFGEFYFGGNNDLKETPSFSEALYLGSAFLFYTEFRAFSEQVDAIKAGVKDTIRPERNVVDIIETVSNDYLIKHGIQVDSDYVLYLAKLSSSLNPKEFLLEVHKNRELESYFQNLQR